MRFCTITPPSSSSKEQRRDRGRENKEGGGTSASSHITRVDSLSCDAAVAAALVLELPITLLTRLGRSCL